MSNFLNKSKNSFDSWISNDTIDIFGDVILNQITLGFFSLDPGNLKKNEVITKIVNINNSISKVQKEHQINKLREFAVINFGESVSFLPILCMPDMNFIFQLPGFNENRDALFKNFYGPQAKKDFINAARAMNDFACNYMVALLCLNQLKNFDPLSTKKIEIYLKKEIMDVVIHSNIIKIKEDLINLFK